MMFDLKIKIGDDEQELEVRFIISDGEFEIGFDDEWVFLFSFVMIVYMTMKLMRMNIVINFRMLVSFFLLRVFSRSFFFEISQKIYFTLDNFFVFFGFFEDKLVTLRPFIMDFFAR